MEQSSRAGIRSIKKKRKKKRKKRVVDDGDLDITAFIDLRHDFHKGDLVHFYTDRTGYRTGMYEKRERKSGLVVVRPTLGVPRRLMRVEPEHVWPLEKTKEG